MTDPLVYPTGSPLNLAGGATSAATPFTQLASNTSTVNGDYFMFLRLAVSDPAGALAPAALRPTPTVILTADGGPPSTPLGESQPIYIPNPTPPPPTIYIADASIVLDTGAPLNNVWIITIDFNPSAYPTGSPLPTHTWTITITNNEAAARDFTWVVSSIETNTLQPWVDMEPATLAWDVLVTGSKGESVQIANRGTTTFTVNSLSPALDPTTFTSVTLPGPLIPGDSQALTVVFTAPAAPPGADGTTSAAPTVNITPLDNAGHNQTLSISTTTQALEIALLLDDSGSMSWNPLGGTATAASPSRWSELLSAVNAFLPLIQTFGTNGGASLGTIGMVRFPISDPTQPDLFPAAPITAANIGAATTALGLVSPFFAGTPMGDGLERVVVTGGYFSSMMTMPVSFKANRRWLLLMTDGAQNIGTHVPKEFIPVPNGTGNVDLNALRISVYTAGYGIADASGVNVVANVDFNVLQNLAAGSYNGGGTSKADEAGLTGTQIAAAFRNAIKSGITAGSSPGDPSAVFQAGQQEARYPALITSYDHKAAFVLAWNTPDPNRMQLQLITPNCEILTPETVEQGEFPGVTFVGGDRYQMYLIQPEFIGNTRLTTTGATSAGAPRYGTWTLLVTSPELSDTKGAAAFENYDYDIILDSDLEMKLALDHSPCYAGDPIVVTARLLAAGKPVKNALVTLSTTAPTQSLTNWIAGVNVPADALATAAKQVEGDSTPLLVKMVGAGLAGFKFSSGTVQTNLGMTDPGNIGTYRATITDTSTPEGYTFYVTAIGVTDDGNAFRREAKISTVVLVRPDPAYTRLDLQFGAEGTAQAVLTARDRFGNVLLLDPANISSLGLTIQGGSFTGPLTSNLDGTYTQPLKFTAGSTPVVGVTFGGKTIIQQPVPPVEKLIWVNDVFSFVAGAEAAKGANLHANPADALGDVQTKAPAVFVSLGGYGSLAVDVKGQVIQAQGSDDIAVFVQPDTDLRSYSVAALPASAKDSDADDWVTLGTSPGTTSFFSLSSAHVTAARAIRITDTSGRTRGKDFKPLSTPGVSIRGVGVLSTAAAGTGGQGGGDGGGDTCIRLQVLNAKKQPLGGTVQIDFQPQDASRPATVQSVDASQDIDVGGLSRTPLGLYEVTVTPSNVFKPTSQFVTIPASGFVTVQFVIDE